MKLYLKKLFLSIIIIALTVFANSLLAGIIIVGFGYTINYVLILLVILLLLCVAMFYVRQKNSSNRCKYYTNNRGNCKVALNVIKSVDWKMEIIVFSTLMIPILVFLIFSDHEHKYPAKFFSTLIMEIVFTFVFSVIDFAIWLFIYIKWEKERFTANATKNQYN